MRRYLSLFLAFVMVVLIVPVVPASAAVAFAGGTGTTSDPYLIETAAQLDAVRNDLDASYKLIADITFKGSDFKRGGDFYNGGKGWDPIGTYDTKTEDKSLMFSGTFDGNGHKVENLVVKRDGNFIGLFGAISNATIKNLKIVGGTFSVEGGIIAAIVGFAEKSTISKCSNSSEIKLTGDTLAVGGILGSGLDCKIENCFNEGNVISALSSKVVGDGVAGIVGAAIGTVTGCYNTGYIAGTSAAGIVGSAGETTITKCYNTGNVVGSVYAAGILAETNSDTYISLCYNTGTIASLSCASGIICNAHYPAVENVFNAGQISDLSGSAMLTGIGYVVEYGEFSNCYNVGKLGLGEKSVACEGLLYDTSAKAPEMNNIYVIGDEKHEKMIKKATYKGFDFSSIWTMDGDEEYPYPELRDVPMVFEKKTASISMEKVPTKTTYQIGDKLDVTDGKIKVTYNNGSTKTVDLKASMVSGFSSSSAGMKVLVVTYDNAMTYYAIEVQHKHNYGKWKNYSSDKHCRVCKDDSSHVEYAEHKWDNGKVTKRATCTSNGIRTYTCSVCGATKIEEIKALGHDWNDGVVTRKATCTQTGVTTYKCSKCGATKTKDIAMTAHNYVDGKCTVCGGISGEILKNGIFAKGNIVRTYGDTRYETSIKTADALKMTLGVSKFDTIIVAYGRNFADALAGSYLAAVKSAPILVVNTETDMSKTNADDYASMQLVKNYIDKNLVNRGTVYVLGGTAVISERFENSLSMPGRTVKRLAGNNRYETNIAILKEAGFSGSDLLVSDAYGYADALSASSLGKPILLVDKSTGKLNNSQLQYLKSVSSKVKNVYLIGGTAAVPNSIQSDIKGCVTSARFTRFAGENRYETSVLLAEKFFPGPNALILAYGHNFPDGLCGGPLGYALKAPLVLTYPSSDNAIYAKAYMNETPTIKYVMALGGQGASTNPQLTDSLVKMIKNGKIVENKY